MSGEGGDPAKLLDRIVGVCFATLLGAMALYGAVRLIASVWVPLCIGVAALAAIVGAWFLIRRGRDW